MTSRRYVFLLCIAGLVVAGVAALWKQDESKEEETPQTSPSQERRPGEESQIAQERGRDERPIPDTNESDEVAGISTGESRDMFGRAIADANKVYFNNIAAANAGDPQAQFNVATLLFHCQRLTPRDAIDTAVRDGQMDTDLAEFERSRLTMCEELDSNVDQDFLPLAGEYLRAAAEQGYPPAIARDMVFRPHAYSLDQARSAVLSLLQTDTVEAYTAGFYFVANYRDEDQISYLAWETLSCEKNPSCDMRALEAERLLEYQSTTLDLVDSRVADITDRIQDGDWVGLQL